MRLPFVFYPMKNTETIIMAPLRGVTTYQFRRAYAQFFDGVDTAMAPFIPPSLSKKINNRSIRDLLPESTNGSYPITPQVLGNNPEVLPPFLHRFAELGFSEINWNLGCPAPQVTKKSKGSALIQNSEAISAFIGALNSDGRFSVTVKARLGLTDSSELLGQLPLFESLGINELIVHPRIATQNYSGVASRTAFKSIQDNTNLHCIYNGDIFSMAFYNETLHHYNINLSKIMMGRGLLINPYLPAQVKEIATPSDKNKHLALFLSALYEEYRHSFSGTTPILGRFKEYWGYLKYSFPQSQKHIKQIMKATTEEKYKAAEQKILSEIEFSAPLSNPILDY